MKYSRRKKDRAELDEPQLDISSLIDVCFLMLIFFLVTTTIGRRSRSG
ncbi:biopolymer transporter ExbD [bacterium]|nr:biopolymer transporter ExbD [bacterium]